MQCRSSALERTCEREGGIDTMADTDQDRVDFLLRDLFYPTVPIPGGRLPILLVDRSTGTRPVGIRPHWRLKLLEELPE